MKKILIPTDFSDNAWFATKYVLNLFSSEECEFFFLHSTKIGVSMASNISKKLTNVMRENAITDLKHLQERAEKVDSNSKHTFKISESGHDLEQAIEITIENHQIDLVVMGTKGASGLKEVLLGSNTINVINKINDCPVLAVPIMVDILMPEDIGFPSDFNRLYKSELLNPIKGMAKISNSIVRIMHINTEGELSAEQQKNLDALTMYLYRSNVKTSYHLMSNYADKTREIVDFIFDFDIDILAMIRYKHSFLEKLLHEPVIKKLGHHLEIPFLIIPE
ncbi:hypothetical protein LPB136_07360 [Tenacibaculum todarodis]|uniref:UspA domain-containing protein n=1 Tax=Tenacibaculum todarodis TaxID=1850252 RepID=A0A1L3JJA4_9FLAO|nr:universal stress protein [Tenacibaculum todarodis]APG65173.1 hypothetical protein LPB136_07360 [Tenacibaculum todarodis]